MDTSILDKAIVFAVKAHQGAERRGNCFPYVVRPFFVYGETKNSLMNSV